MTKLDVLLSFGLEGRLEETIVDESAASTLLMTGIIIMPEIKMQIPLTIKVIL